MINSPLGTIDILPDEAKFWTIFQQKARDVFGRYGYVEISTPLFEQTDLFVRGIGEATDVVSKEMFRVISGGNLEKVFAGEQIKAKSNLSLRPEGTAGVVRAVIQNGMLPQGSAPLKLMYAGPMFRAERPQDGRQRQFMQIGVECLGDSEASIDAEGIIMLMRFYEALGFETKKLNLVLNSMGCPNCRANYRKDLLEFLKKNEMNLCETCVERIEKNPLRTLDCKNEKCQKVLDAAPKISDYLCDDCKNHYEEVKGLLKNSGIKFVEDWKLVRGLDYYTRTVFEIQSGDVGAQDALCGGGRYDGLVKELGGNDTPGFGFALGYERTLLAMKNNGFEFEPAKTCDYFVAIASDGAKEKAFEVAQSLRDYGCNVEIDHQSRSLKSQFKLADKFMAKFTIIIGEDELQKGELCIRNMETHDQENIKQDKLFAFVEGKL